MTAALELSEVTKTFGGVVANDGINMRVPQGSIVGLIGPNGSGKTTLFNAITGAYPVDSGSIRFRGEEISRLPAGAVARAGIIRTFQQPRLYAGMTARENMLASAGMRAATFPSLFRRHDATMEARSQELLEFVGLGSKGEALGGNLSFGQQKLLELAMALVNKPQMLLLDEPTAGINPAFIGNVTDLIKGANKALGLTLLVIEHNMPVIMDLAQHIYCLAHGRLIAEGPPDTIKNSARVVGAYLGAA